MLNTNLVATNDHVVVLPTDSVAALGEHAKVLVPNGRMYLLKEIGIPRSLVVCGWRKPCHPLVPDPTERSASLGENVD